MVSRRQGGGRQGQAATDVNDLSQRSASTGVVAMVLAQETSILLLDEPTAFLDIDHQIELLDLLADLNDQGRAIVAGGTLAQIFTADLVETLFNLSSIVMRDRVSHTTMIVPEGPPLDRSQKAVSVHRWRQ
jgi:iron complex transport system ATP-binding protein